MQMNFDKNYGVVLVNFDEIYYNLISKLTTNSLIEEKYISIEDKQFQHVTYPHLQSVLLKPLHFVQVLQFK